MMYVCGYQQISDLVLKLIKQQSFASSQQTNKSITIKKQQLQNKEEKNIRIKSILKFQTNKWSRNRIMHDSQNLKANFFLEIRANFFSSREIKILNSKKYRKLSNYLIFQSVKFHKILHIFFQQFLGTPKHEFQSIFKRFLGCPVANQKMGNSSLVKLNRNNQNHLESQFLEMSRKSSVNVRIQFPPKPVIVSVAQLKPQDIDLQSIISQLRQKTFLHIDKILQIIWTSSKQLQRLPNLISIKSPVLVVGDIHGQFYDLLNIFQQFGKVESASYLFMGDFVDRGQFCIEVITLLLCMKIKYPRTVHLLRGNHESRVLTSTFNFRQQCNSLAITGLHKYDQSVYSAFVQLFDYLPLGAIVDDKYFCVHAGISPDLETIQKIQKVNRFKEPPERGGVCDLLWSDPVEEVQQRWMPNKNRMCSYFYGIFQSKQFLDKNKLKLIIRGHQVQNAGYKYQKNNNGKPLTLTIFSAPNYCDSYRNKGSVLKITKQKLNIFSFAQVEHPLVLPNHMNLFEWSIPFLAEEVTKIFKYLLKLERTKQKKIRSDKILQNESVFKAQVLALARIELVQRLVSEKKLKNEQQLLRKNIKALCQFSTCDFLQIRQGDQGEKHPLQFIQVIGPKLHQSFKKLSSIRSLQMEQTQKNNDLNEDYNQFDTESTSDAHLWKQIPTFRSLG